MKTIVDKTLAQRGSVYGKYADGLIFRGTLVKMMCQECEETTGNMLSSDVIAFTDIIGKISRLLVVPGHKDSWVDLAGYARLNQNRFKKHQETTPVKDPAGMQIFAMCYWEAIDGVVKRYAILATEDYERKAMTIGKHCYGISRAPTSIKAWKALADYAEKIAKGLK